MKKSLLICAAISLSACDAGTRIGGGGGGGGGGSKPDLAIIFDPVDAGGGGEDMVSVPIDPNACGDFDPACQENGLGPNNGKPFPITGDPMMDPNAKDDGVNRDPNGWLALSQSKAAFDFLWVANSNDWNSGTVSKLNSKTIREVARYVTVTCFSTPTGNRQACDGTNGCCAADDYPRWLARKGGGQVPGRQQVLLSSNSPSRTAVDFNGDLFVSNRAFGGQSSVTKIANEIGFCKDRNKNGRIETSSDGNADGLIQTDCNGNGKQDDIDDVKQAPCQNGMKQEFFGLDDECILWTTNTNTPNQLGRPLGLGPGSVDNGPSDAWPGGYSDGKFFRIDGTSGQYKDQVQLPQGCQPYGLTVDSSGFAWAPNLGSGPLCFFNTKKTTEVGQARTPTFGQMQGYGVALDRDQNIWVGGLGSPDAYRYKPDRTKGFMSLPNGYWVKITSAGRNAGASGPSYGVAADSRTQNQYWVYLAVNSGHVSRVPGSDLDKMLPNLKMDNLVDGAAFPAVQVAGTNVRGVGVDRDQNLWLISNNNSVATRVKVDMAGTMMAPDINSAPAGNNKCPGGDRCVLKDRNVETAPYTYSDFTGFGLRNFTRPTGTYSYLIKGCEGQQPDTQWYSIVWDADVPPNTRLKVRARTGITSPPDQTWGAWTTDFTMSPADLRTGMPIQPFDKDNHYLQVEFTFSTSDKAATPRLKSFKVGFKCGVPG